MAAQAGCERLAVAALQRSDDRLVLLDRFRPVPRMVVTQEADTLHAGLRPARREAASFGALPGPRSARADANGAGRTGPAVAVAAELRGDWYGDHVMIVAKGRRERIGVMIEANKRFRPQRTNGRAEARRSL